MAINLEKSDNKVKFYYSENGKQYGPYNREDIISKIDRDTLVWREGIEWTNASKLEEFKSVFQSEISQSDEFEYTVDRPYVESKSTSVNQKMFSAPFSFNGRIRRLEYGISIIIYYTAAAILNAIAIDSPIFLLGFIPILWFLFAQGTKRCHDRGNPGWWQIIPYYVFWMIFADGVKHDSVYGSSPK
jgi:hypothetical protein|tara:strand:+ start:322 stop:882 length:561 start_codon:yes stop_codon:yes gene_type:complete